MTEKMIVLTELVKEHSKVMSRIEFIKLNKGTLVLKSLKGVSSLSLEDDELESLVIKLQAKADSLENRIQVVAQGK